MNNISRMENSYNKAFMAEARRRMNKMNICHYHKPYYHDKIVGEVFRVPDGVTDLETECLSWSEIGTLILPDSLKTIGTYGEPFDDNKYCVLANCKIGTVILPVGLEILGNFAFGGCEIENMTIHGLCLYSQYARQIKDSKVKQLTIDLRGYECDIEESGLFGSILCNTDVEMLVFQAEGYTGKMIDGDEIVNRAHVGSVIVNR